MTDETVLRVEDVGRVRLLTLDRPAALNAFDDDLYDAVSAALADASACTFAVDLEVTRSELLPIHDRQGRSFKGCHRIHGKEVAESRVRFRIFAAVFPLHRVAEHKVEFAGSAQHPFLCGVLEQRRIAGQARPGLRRV